jgi:capsular polysaccharide biosynthesis protein
MMEAMASAQGFEVVPPETLGFLEQAALFRSADCVLGEYGSAMHGAVFADPGTVVAVVGAFSHIQAEVAAAFGQQAMFMRRIAYLEDAASPASIYTAREDDLAGLLAFIERLRGDRYV